MSRSVLVQMRMLALALVLALLASCVTHHRVEVTGAALERELTALRERGSASVEVEERRDDETFARRETIHVDQVLGGPDEPYVVRDLIAKCPGDQCALTSMWNVPIKVREYETRSATPVLKGVLGTVLAAGAIGAVGCGISCEEGTTANTVADYVTIGYGVLIVGGFTYLLVRCLRGDGCAD